MGVLRLWDPTLELYFGPSLVLVLLWDRLRLLFGGHLGGGIESQVKNAFPRLSFVKDVFYSSVRFFTISCTPLTDLTQSTIYVLYPLNTGFFDVYYVIRLSWNKKPKKSRKTSGVHTFLKFYNIQTSKVLHFFLVLCISFSCWKEPHTCGLFIRSLLLISFIPYS